MTREVLASTTVETAIDVRPFHVDIPDEALDDLPRLIAATRWPSNELVADAPQGVQLATLQELARYWTTEYDWRRAEKKLNALPQFNTAIDGLEIHFIHVKSSQHNALRQGAWGLHGENPAERDGPAFRPAQMIGRPLE